MDTQKLKKFFEFATELEKLKKIERFKGQHYWKDYPQPTHFESVADHTWRLGMLVIILTDQLSKKIDLEKALKMVLIHDLPEIIAGDGSPLGDDGMGQNSYAFNHERAQERHNEEKEAAISIFNMLPAEEAKKFFNLWLEYERQESFESKVVKSLDKIEALMQVLEYRKGHLFKDHLEFNKKYALKGSEIDPAINEFGNHIFSEMEKEYKEFTKDVI
ncbi:MAG: HD domain-containing protein [Candidatus Buchananbacteria bacterium]